MDGEASAQIVKTQDTVYLKEITAPSGYRINATAYNVKLEVSKTTTVTVLDPFRYLEFLLTEMMEHEEDTDYGFLDDLLPWSESIPDICKIQSKK